MVGWVIAFKGKRQKLWILFKIFVSKSLLRQKITMEISFDFLKIYNNIFAYKRIV